MEAILAFDVCLRSMNVTILNQANHVTRRRSAEAGGQAENLVPLIEEVREAANCSWTDISRIGVTLGPGGFTSVRVGLATARGLAMALGIPAFGISTLELLARTANEAEAKPHFGRLLSLIPAGKGGVYAQVFDGRSSALTAPTVVEASELSTIVHSGDWLIGPGVQLVLPTLEETTKALIACDSQVEPSSLCLARHARGLTQRTELRPVYLRAADAKPQTGKGLARA